jgi:hypothetical protein
MVVMFVGSLCSGRRYFHTIPTVENLRGGRFLFPPEPL